MDLLHGVNQALRAHHLYKRDVDYLVKDGQVVIVDEFTGRMMPGRRWSDGLHQAVEAKEGVKIERENQTLATITFQNYFRMYKKLSGMTGTADTEAAEFEQIYNLDVVVIPTNRADDPRRPRPTSSSAPSARSSTPWSRRSRTATSAASRCWSARSRSRRARCSSGMLKRKGIPHDVLNAKYHEREAAIVAQAGRKGAVTIATNMAGRGTDILLGGNPEGLARCEADPATEAEAYAQRPTQRYLETCAPRARRGHRSAAACTSSAPSGTSRGASTTSCAAAPAARATPARRASSSRSRTT